MQWKAPLPVIHCHAEPANSAMESCLNRHLAAWHSEGAEWDWHLHFAMLGDILRGRGCPIPSDDDTDEPLTSECSVLVDQVAKSRSFQIEAMELAFEQRDELTEACNCIIPNAWRREFLEGHAESRRLQTVLCVAQC